MAPAAGGDDRRRSSRSRAAARSPPSRAAPAGTGCRAASAGSKLAHRGHRRRQKARHQHGRRAGAPAPLEHRRDRGGGGVFAAGIGLDLDIGAEAEFAGEGQRLVQGRHALAGEVRGRTSRRHRSCRIAASGCADTGPRAVGGAVERESWHSTSAPSPVSRTSNSTQLQPSALAPRKPGERVFRRPRRGAAMPDDRRAGRSRPGEPRRGHDPRSRVARWSQSSSPEVIRRSAMAGSPRP